MTWLTRSVTVLLLALWVPVAMHCTLELLPGMHWLQCCCADESDTEGHSDCGENACGSVESGAFKVEDCGVFIPRPVLAAAAVAALADEPVGRLVCRPATPGPAPPELARVWQFSRRTALPPRAPSLVA